MGTPNWSQNVDVATESPITGQNNVMYTFHFYAATHGDWLRQKLQAALDKDLPVFVSEFGICDASGNGALDLKSAKKWKKLIEKNDLSWCAWNLSNKGESSSLLKASTKKVSGWKNSQLSKSGKWVKKWMKG